MLVSNNIYSSTEIAGHVFFFTYIQSIRSIYCALWKGGGEFQTIVIPIQAIFDVILE